MNHERHYIDGDQLSQEILQRILSQIGVKDNVAITIVHNGTIGGVIAKKYNSDIFIHTNDKALAKAAINYGAMNLYMVEQVLINKDQKYLSNEKPNLIS